MTAAQMIARLEERLARIEAALERLEEHVGAGATGPVAAHHPREHEGVPAGVILRLPEVRVKTGMSRSLIYDQQARGIFPPNVPLGARAVGWIDDEVDAVIAARAAGADDESIRALVASLVAERRRR